MDEKQRKTNPNPFVKANFFSKLFLFWVSPLLTLGYQRPIKEDDLYSPIKEEESEHLTEQLEKEWKKELSTKKKPSLTNALLRIYSVRMLFLFILITIEEASKMTIPFLISAILSYFDNKIDLNQALIYGSLLCLCMTINSVIHHPYFMQVVLTGMKMRIACSGVIYKKLFSLKFSSAENQSIGGQIINMISNDVSRIEFAPYFIAYLVIGPIEAIIIIYILIQMVNVYFLVGLVLLVILIPTQSIIGKFNDRIRRIVTKKCDKRINLLSEFLNAIKIIKLNCWEIPFKRTIEQIRKKELKYQKYLFYITTFNSTFDLVLPSMLTYISVTAFIFFAKSALVPSFIVLAMSFYMKLNGSMGFFFIKAITFLISANVSLKRIQAFLLQDEVQRVSDYKESIKPQIILDKVSASWKTDYDSFCLKDLNFEVNDNELVAIVGAVGSGKSSLLSTLISEINSIKGNIKLDGSVFYLQQEPWVFSASVKQNILFGKTFIKEKFNDVVRVCCLEQDLKALANRENTIIGEKGVNLSGGQKARISLARAVYNDAQIYLFDDPLSAVDATVSKSIFNECIQKYLNKKIRVLVTNNLHCLKDVDKIILLNDGKIQAIGTYTEMTNKGIDMGVILNEAVEAELRKRLESELSVQSSKSLDESLVNEDEIDLMLSPEQRNSIVSQSLLNVKRSSLKIQLKEYEENQNIGKLSWQTYFKFFKIGGGVMGAMCYFFFILISQALITGSDYWISNWAFLEQNENSIKMKQFNNSDQLCTNCSNRTLNDMTFSNRNYYYSIYSLILFLGLLATIIRELIFFQICINSSRKMHATMFNSVMSTSIRFFDLNPLGRILNRFSKDINILDETIPWTINDFMHVLMLVLSSVAMNVFLNYWTLVTLIPLVLSFIYIRRYYLRTSLEVKRIEAVNRSPILVHVNNTISGVSVIRATNSRDTLVHEYNAHTDYHTRAVSAFVSLNRWFAIRLDWIAVIFSYIVIFSCILLKDSLHNNSGQIGIMLVYLCQLLNLFQWTIRQSCECENLMTSIERILEYTTLPSEPLDKGAIEPPIDWIKQGRITFDNVSFSYAENLPDILHNLSFEIKSNEKIGIIGRTGAGKSSIIQSLFRMAEPKGKILIDDVDIKQISLHNLRGKLSIIPQDPTLFIGTLRFNLDPFDQHTDNEIWSSLEKVQLKKTVQEMKDGLMTEITKGGSNLSCGQRQLVSLARALIKKSKVLVIDEATANVDYKTDFLVQKAIRECFHDCTVVSIAHRLRTIIDNDRIICLSNGELKDFGTPHDLINDKKSILYEFINSLDKTEAQELTQIAYDAFKRKNI